MSEVHATTWYSDGPIDLKIQFPTASLVKSLQALAGAGYEAPIAGGYKSEVRAIADHVVHRAITELWRDKWRAQFEHRWYAIVHRRTGLSGQSFVLSRQTGWSQSAPEGDQEFRYQIRNTASYANFVHRSGSKRTVMSSYVRIWVRLFAVEAAQQITARFQAAWKPILQQALRAAIARRQAQALRLETYRRLVAARLRRAIAKRAA